VIAELSTLTTGYEVVDLQETGGCPEITALAAEANLDGSPRAISLRHAR
jgi:hypothetical protein